MDRKGFLEQMALFGGCTLVAPTILLHSCNTEPRVWKNVSAADINLLNDIGETILPTTKALPGAKQIEIGEYIIDVVNNCLEPEDQNTFLDGLGIIDALCVTDYGKNFEGLREMDKNHILLRIQNEATLFDEEQEGKEEPKVHYFSLLKELAITGYFTSKTIVTEVFDYSPIPGRYNGCVDFDAKKDKIYKG